MATMKDILELLGAEAERLGNKDLTGEALKEELERARGLKETSGAMTAIYEMALSAERLRADISGECYLPKMLTDETGENCN